MVEPRKFNPLDEDVAPPLDVEIDGVTYPVGGDPRSVTTEMLSEVNKTATKDPENPDTIAKCIGIFLRVSAKIFKESDFRVLSHRLKWIQSELLPKSENANRKKIGGKKKKKNAQKK